jgi:guanosine-3',5'-bis(diphosphate) 3'-pyrophosphohydrolase
MAASLTALPVAPAAAASARPSPDALIAKIRAYAPAADLDMVRLAYDFAADAHEGQFRHTGEPYIIHPLAAAGILADLKLPVPIVVACLLHDVPEDTAVTLDDIRANFGDDVARMVEGITKLGKLKYRGMERYVENLRKMFVAIAKDVRVVFIKFADRIHNLSTLDALAPEKRLRVALESLEIYAPIANRLGMNDIKVQLEDLAFKHVFPKEYEWTKSLSEQAIGAKKGYVDGVSRKLEDELKSNGIAFASVGGRVKHLYSLYKKLVKKDRDVAQIHDLVALRVLVPSVGDCYAALGIVHKLWKPMGGRIKDYISQPKPNGYQSLHTTVFCDGGEIVEFQIRTQAMHDEAERGIAAHWQYDESGKKSTSADAEKLAWVKDFVDKQLTVEGTQEYLESLEAMKIDVFQNRIFVFTPKGDVIDLPEGATVVDFAYAIHTDVGNRCTAGRINDRLVSLDEPLSSGDCCEIVTDKHRKYPNPDWVKFVKTGMARDRIRQAGRVARKAENDKLRIDKK